MHPRIGFEVSSYWVRPAGVAIDPVLPAAGIEAFAGDPPHTIVLTNHHHDRQSPELVAAFGCEVRVHASAAGMLGTGVAARAFEFGDEVAPGVRALEVAAICPDDTALHLAAEGGALAFADAVIHWGDRRVGFVRDHYMGDDPEGVKRGVRASVARLLETVDFDTLLFAHGEPIVGGGRAALEQFLRA
jgi:hypothetical protein